MSGDREMSVQIIEKLSWPDLRYYPGICPERLKKIMKNLVIAVLQSKF